MPNLRQFVSPQFVPLLFLPAGVGILFRIVLAQTSAEQLLGLALLLFCPELARMAKVDLDNIAAVVAQSAPTSPLPTSPLPTSPLPTSPLPTSPVPDQSLPLPAAQLPEDSRLGTFHKIVVSTIVLELLGFYTVFASLQWGGIIIIFSQLWFNLLAKIQLFPHERQAVTSFGLLDRLPVLMANVIGLVLLAVWSIAKKRLELSIALLALIALFLLLKYGLPVLRGDAEQNAPKVLLNEDSED